MSKDRQLEFLHCSIDSQPREETATLTGSMGIAELKTDRGCFASQLVLAPITNRGCSCGSKSGATRASNGDADDDLGSVGGGRGNDADVGPATVDGLNDCLLLVHGSGSFLFSLAMLLGISFVQFPIRRLWRRCRFPFLSFILWHCCLASHWYPAEAGYRCIQGSCGDFSSSSLAA